MARDVLTVQQFSGPSNDHVANRLKFILAEVKLLAAEYYQLTGKPLGVTGEIAEYVASEILKLELVPPRTPGYDALRRFADGTYERVQIKGRAFDPAIAGSQRMGKIKSEGPCDVVMLVLLHSASLDPIEIWEAPFAAVVARLAEPGSRSRNERGSLAVSNFKQLGIMVWSGEGGEPRYDCNLAGHWFRFRQAVAFVSIVSWSAFSLPASKSRLIARYLMPKLLTQEVVSSAKNRSVFDWNGGRLHVGIRNHGFRQRFAPGY